MRQTYSVEVMPRLVYKGGKLSEEQAKGTAALLKDLGDQCNYHVFVSHVWKTGQDAAVRVAPSTLHAFVPPSPIWFSAHWLLAHCPTPHSLLGR